MRNKKLFLPAVILGTAIILIAVYLFVFSIAFKPMVTEGEFPFTITYEFNGEKITIDDVYKAYYDRNDGYADTKSRVYLGEIGDMGEGNTIYIINKDEDGRIELHTNFYPDYLMGDTEYDYFDDEPFEPEIYYYDLEEQEYNDEETLSAQGVKLISWEYPSAIENSFVFSHLSYFNGEVVILTVLIALVALIAILIWVKKEKDLKYRVIDIISIVFNFILCFTVIPFATIVGFFIDIEGGGAEISRQIMYFFPWLSILGIAASVSLRRKGYGKSSLAAQLLFPMIFCIICAIIMAFNI